MATDLDHADRAILDAFHRAATYPSSSKARKLMRAPVRSVAIKVGNPIGSRTGWSIPVRARTFWGVDMRVRVPEAVSNQLFCCGLFEPSMTAFMLQVLRKGQAFVDIGAHYGYFTLLAARLVGKEGRVDAFEPTPSTFGVLASNVRSLPNVAINQVAVWSERSELDVMDLGTRLSAYNSVFPPRLGGGAPAGRLVKEVRVEAVSLDDYCSSQGIRPNFVKIDAESAEHRILQGMEHLLIKDRPFVSLEVGDFGIPGVPSSSSLLGAMIDKEYAPFEYADGLIRPHIVCDSYQYDNVLFAPREHPFTRQFAAP
jgi:FkbM family methyltransferase